MVAHPPGDLRNNPEFQPTVQYMVNPYYQAQLQLDNYWDAKAQKEVRLLRLISLVEQTPAVIR